MLVTLRSLLAVTLNEELGNNLVFVVYSSYEEHRARFVRMTHNYTLFQKNLCFIALAKKKHLLCKNFIWCL